MRKVNAKGKISGWKKAAVFFCGILAVLILIFASYVSRYYHADESALAALSSTEEVNVQEEGKYILFDGPGEETAYIFYPGAKVETESYAPLMRKLAENGIDAFLVDMPFHLAFFGLNRAEEIISKNSGYSSWYIGGHSLGGAMAASYAAEHQHLDQLDGVILMAAYPTKSLDAENFQVLSFYGSEDQVLNMEKFEAGRDYMPEDYLEIEISGGNHAQFGNYGEQSGDGAAKITAEEQQEMVVQTVVGYMKDR